LRLEWGREALAVPAAMEMLGFDRDFGPCITACVLDRTNRVAAVLVFHNYAPEAGVIEVSAAAESAAWAQRGILREAFGYVFAHCQMAVARCAESNTRVRRLWAAFGADEVVIPRLRGRDEAECILTLTDDAWRLSRFAR